MLKSAFIILLLLTEITMAQNNNLAYNLYNDYDTFKEQTISSRRFKHSDIQPLINRLKTGSLFKVVKAGESAEGRDINLISVGSGTKKVFLWSQMHGDEPTATMALLDIFNFFSGSGYEEYKKTVLGGCTIYFMPMVNPDGAEIYERRNIFDIDINRDAVRQQTPEGIILRSTFENLKADFGFNLHDQSTRYSAGNSFKSAAISFLAPAYDYDKSFNDVRGKAVKLIGELNMLLSAFIPGHIAKYSDDFEPRAFGDNFQKWGTSTVLVETGGWKDDTEKQFLRKLNFILLLSAFESIATESYKDISDEVYDGIPFNEKYIFDLLLRNLKTVTGNHEYKVDLGINLNEVNFNSGKEFFYSSAVEDLGDLSVFYGYNDLNLEGMTVEPGKLYDKVFDSIEEINKLDFYELYSSGFTAVKYSGSYDKPFTLLPINISLGNSDIYPGKVELSSKADFVIKKENLVKYVIINGFVIDVENKTGKIQNGRIYR